MSRLTAHRTIGAVALLAGFYVVTISPAQEAQREGQILPSIKKLMSHEEFSKAGLPKLNDDEINALDAWLQRFTLGIVKTLTSKSGGEPAGGVVETQIDDAFTGWSGDAVWKMTNGQIWQQSAYAYHYHYAYRPKVLIYRSSSGWKMKVEGVSEEVSVKMIR